MKITVIEPVTSVCAKSGRYSGTITLIFSFSMSQVFNGREYKIAELVLLKECV